MSIFLLFQKTDLNEQYDNVSDYSLYNLRGLIANAMGLQRNDFVLQDKMIVGIVPLSSSQIFTELAKILKLKEGEKRDRPQIYPSSPMYKELLVNVSMKIYLGIEDGDYFNLIVNALSNPARPLYIGQSDDMVVISDIKGFGTVKKKFRFIFNGHCIRYSQ